MFRNILLAIIAVSFIACAGSPTKDPVLNNMETESGATLWASSYTPSDVQIDKSYEFVGSHDRSNQKASRKYYAWKKSDDQFIFIVDFKVKGTWTFPKTNDGLLGKDGNKNDPELLAYEPFQYSIWKKLNAKSIETLKLLEIIPPDCYVTFTRSTMSPSRNAAFFVVYVEKTACNYNEWGGIGNRFNDAISM